MNDVFQRFQITSLHPHLPSAKKSVTTPNNLDNVFLLSFPSSFGFSEGHIDVFTSCFSSLFTFLLSFQNNVPSPIYFGRDIFERGSQNCENIVVFRQSRHSCVSASEKTCQVTMHCFIPRTGFFRSWIQSHSFRPTSIF